MTSSGRCHGPGCTQTAKTEFWCSERCQERWDLQIAGLPVPEPMTVDQVARLFDVPARMLTGPIATIATVYRDEDGLHVTGHWLPLPDPARGWLARTLDRLFGRTT